ncbi:PLP-dependent aminotransferase family protein [Bradyrhizobium erythrophlei]|jgi:GntR family transcriptional regulator/MocR family aminotransferase|uniref:Transcriptional regulator, GntR family n=1 Tax=Bradyrhizobium erythrophlei TaxID=1437360 RepID=A0A1M7UUB2_9BRAD|nr:PLP-dependent aminotransferase family protein [Bradyrhizobium erythrophlei]SHN86535.1 transcriptional regulator, GntR family [Bradyrhizobium erythrophlei]
MAISPTTLKRRRQTLLDLPLRLDPARGSQSLQVHASLRSAILEGRLTAGLRLPSSRDLARQFRVRRNVVVAAYEHLLSDGLVEAHIGAGTYVAAELPPRARPAKAVSLASAAGPGARGPFALGRTYAAPDLLQRLGIAVRRHISAGAGIDRGYGDPRGSEALREQIALHLAATRGIRCDPACVVILGSTQQALRLCAEALLKPGDAVWFEDPGYPFSRQALEAARVKIVPVPVDSQGLDVPQALKQRPSAKAVYITPSHQFPLGVTMSMSRRVALLDWARASQGWIFEDDYDSEFRYAGPPLTALAGIDGHDRVIYLGTFSKMMFSSLRLSFAVLPSTILTEVTKARLAYDRFPPSFVETAVADLMSDGFLSAHARRMRARYRAARDVVTQTIAEASHGILQVQSPEQGMHMVAHLPERTTAETAGSIRAAANVESRLLSEMRMTKGKGDGFVLGFAGHGIGALETAARRLGRAARDHFKA